MYQRCIFSVLSTTIIFTSVLPSFINFLSFFYKLLKYLNIYLLLFNKLSSYFPSTLTLIILFYIPQHSSLQQFTPNTFTPVLTFFLLYIVFLSAYEIPCLCPLYSKTSHCILLTNSYSLIHFSMNCHLLSSLFFRIVSKIIRCLNTHFLHLFLNSVRHP